MYIHKGQKSSREDEVTEQKKGSIWVIAKQYGKTCVELKVLGEVICYASKFLEDSSSVWTMVMESMNDKTVQVKKLKLDPRAVIPSKTCSTCLSSKKLYWR